MFVCIYYLCYIVFITYIGFLEDTAKNKINFRRSNIPLASSSSTQLQEVQNDTLTFTIPIFLLCLIDNSQ